MNKRMKNQLAQVYEEVSQAYLKEFCEKHKYDYDPDGFIRVGGRIGDAVCIGDMYVSLDDIRLDIDEDIPAEKFEDWYWYCLELGEYGLKTINFYSFWKGAPWPVSPEKFSEIKASYKRLKDMQTEFEKSIENYKSKDSDGPFF